MISSSVLLIGYAAGIVLAAVSVVLMRQGSLRTVSSLRAVVALCGAFFAALAVVTAVAWFTDPFNPWRRQYITGILFSGFAAYIAFTVIQRLGQINRSVESSLASVADTPGVSAKSIIVKPTIRFGFSRKPADVQLGQNQSAQGAGATPSRFVLAPKGTASAQSVAAWQQVIERAYAGGPRKIVIDLAYITSLDSAAANAIVQLCGRFGYSQCTIAAPAGSVAEHALRQVDPAIPIEPALPAGDPLQDAIERAESQTEAQKPATPSDANTWKGF